MQLKRRKFCGIDMVRNTDSINCAVADTEYIGA